MRDSDIYEVQLDEGDILYHPAGIWHQVECVTDESISINFSLRQLRVADLIANVIFLLQCLLIYRQLECYYFKMTLVEEA